MRLFAATGIGRTRWATALSVLILYVAAVFVALASAPQANAGFCDPLLNGPYTAVSDGARAQTNDVYHDEATVTSTWTISTSCGIESPPDCAGEVVSSQGWRAPINCDAAGQWSVRRHLDNWEPCKGGVGAPADQLLYFSPDVSGSPSFAAVKTFSGWDRTVGASGGCGINQPLVIEMPLRLSRVQ
jgi:hypothetical protein